MTYTGAWTRACRAGTCLLTMHSLSRCGQHLPSGAWGSALNHRAPRSRGWFACAACAVCCQLSDFGLARVKAYTATMTGNCGTYQWCVTPPPPRRSLAPGWLRRCVRVLTSRVALRMAPEVLANARYTEKADGTLSRRCCCAWKGGASSDGSVCAAQRSILLRCGVLGVAYVTMPVRVLESDSGWLLRQRGAWLGVLIQRFRFRAQVAMAVLNEGKRLAIPDSTPSGAWHA